MAITRKANRCGVATERHFAIVQLQALPALLAHGMRLGIVQFVAQRLQFLIDQGQQ